MNWKGRRVLVTGGAGFVGSHLAEALVRGGARVRVLVRYNSSYFLGALRYLPAPVFRETELYPGDLWDAEAVRLAARKMEVVFHLGALIAIPYSYVHPREVVETNVLGTLNVLQAVSQNGAERLVHASTSEVYGSARYVPMDEAHPLQGQSPYSASKIAADKLAESFHRSYGTPVVIVRPFNTYGERQSQRAVIPTLIHQALRGSVVRLGAVSPRRDFTYVSDTVDAFLRAAACREAVGRVLNAGSGKETSVQRLVDLVGSLLGKKLRVATESRRLRPRESEVERLLADARQARKLLGWRPQVDLPTGLQRVIAWARANPQDNLAGRYMT